MIKHTLKEGNRVRVVTHNGGVQNQYCEQSHLFGETGIVVRVDPNFTDVRIKLEGKEIECIEEVDYRCLKRIDRTFEEIVKELKGKLGVFWSIEKLNKDYAALANSTLDVIVVHKNGRLEIYYRHAINPTVTLFATQLAAISAACSEIADNYEAEKEEQK